MTTASSRFKAHVKIMSLFCSVDLQHENISCEGSRRGYGQYWADIWKLSLGYDLAGPVNQAKGLFFLLNGFLGTKLESIQRSEGQFNTIVQYQSCHFFSMTCKIASHGDKYCGILTKMTYLFIQMAMCSVRLLMRMDRNQILVPLSVQQDQQQGRARFLGYSFTSWRSTCRYY